MAYRLSSDRQPGINTANERKTKKKKKKIKSAAEIAADGFIKKFLAKIKNRDLKNKPKLPKPDIKTRKDSVMYSGHSPGYPKTLDVNYAKDLAAQKKQKTKTLSASINKKKKN